MCRPIVAADLAALREILPPDAARYVAPGSTEALAAGIRWVAEHPEDAAAMAERAREAASAYTYVARARSIVDFCQRVIGAQA
jgi:glycosyltransferase involved in cell wall biosynthesis